MYNTRKIVVAVICLLSTMLNAQTNQTQLRYTDTNKGKFFFIWGGNRETYSKSDITFKGDGYNFTIKDATAHDKPKGWHVDYINPTRITIPQTNFKLGYFISDNYVISFGVDHMKYVMDRNETRYMTGTINLPTDEEGSVFNGTYDNDPYFVSEDFLKFEHTNGLNYVYLDFARYDDISSIFRINNTDKFQVNLTEGFGAGLLYPKTNTTLMYKERYDEFHVSGFGVSFSAGINFTFFKHFIIQGDLKTGYINMGDIRTTHDPAGRASQHFWYLQRILSIGGIFRI